MLTRTLQSRVFLNLSRCRLHNASNKLLLRSCAAHQTRSFLEALTTPFSRKELRAAATGNPDLGAEYHLVYVGPLARRIATYKIGAFFLSACGFAVAPIIVATAEVPFMALPIALIAFLPLVGYHYLTRKYVLSMHIYVPPQVRNDLRSFTTYVNALKNGSIIRLRTFRLIFGIKSHIVPVEELKLVTVPGRIQAFEKNVEWVSSSLRSKTVLGGRKAWYIQPGLGGQEMDFFWRRIGMDEERIKESRDKAIARMREMAQKKVDDMKNAVEKYQSDKPGKNGKKKSTK